MVKGALQLTIYNEAARNLLDKGVPQDFEKPCQWQELSSSVRNTTFASGILNQFFVQRAFQLQTFLLY